MSVEFYYLSAALMLLVFAVRLPGLLRGGWRDPLLRSFPVLLALGSAIFFFAAPPTITWVNGVTGITNFSAPLVYGLLTAVSAAIIHQMITWRGGPEEQRRRAVHWCCAVYAAVIVSLFVLFFLGHAPVERLRDLDTYYANTPFIREMIVVNVAAHTLSSVTMALLCGRWYREVAGLLRGGLALIATGALFNFGYDACKTAAMCARWLGRDWDTLSTDIAPPIALIATFLLGTGYVFPSAAERWADAYEAWIRHRRLAPLWLLLREVIPGASVRMSWWSAPAKRQLQRTCDILDGLAVLRPYADDDARADTYARLRASGTGHPQAAAAADAAMLVTAVEAFRADPGYGARVAGRSVGAVLRDDPDSLERVATALKAPLEVAVREEHPHEGTATVALR